MADGIVLQVGVKAFIKNDAGKYLLVRRNSTKYAAVSDPWDIVGGRINPGVSLVENLAREVREETGMELRDEPRLIAAQDILRLPEKHIVRLTYIAAADRTPVLSEEHQEFKWVSLDEMKSTEGLDRYVREIVEQRGNLL